MFTLAKPLKKFLAAGTIAAALALTVPSMLGGAAFAATINTHQVLRAGDHGQAVKMLQKKLHSLHYYRYNIDGLYGPITRTAVKGYQHNHGLAVDGIAGPHTLGALFHSHSANKKSPKTLRIGDHGKVVKHLQQKLKDRGYYTYTIDGIFGPITKKAVSSFKKDHGLRADGIAGPKTWAALNGKKKKEAVAGTETSGSDVSHIISDAKALIGTPYVWGGTSPNGFDCSGFVQYVFKENGISIPRTVSAMWNDAKPVNTLEPGDLVFFHTYKAGPSHVGIYIGNGKFIQAGSSTGVKISKMDLNYWSSRYLGAKSEL